jgi:Sulfotransferase domain
MSTAFERIMRARGDMECLHEPFMYDYYINRSRRKMPHFDPEDGRPRSYDAIRDMILEKAERGPVFFKDMGYYVVPHVLADLEFLGRLTHSFLVRDLKASIISYVKLDADVTSEEIGIEAQWHLASFLMDRYGKPPIVMSSEKIQADPAGQMQRYWQATNLPGKPEALSWNDPAPEDWQQVSGWHQDVMSTRTIRPVSSMQETEAQSRFEKLLADQPRFRQIYDHHAGFHDKLMEIVIP